LDLDAISRSFQAAQAKNDPAVVEKWSQLQTQAAQKILALEPQDPGKKEAWKQNKEAPVDLLRRRVCSFQSSGRQPRRIGGRCRRWKRSSPNTRTPLPQNALSANFSKRQLVTRRRWSRAPSAF